MPVRPLLYYPNPLLLQKSEEVTNFGHADLLNLVEDLKSTANFYHAHGLAAVQIGVPLRAFLIKGVDGSPQIFVNPRYLDTAGIKCGAEGCLSFPGVEEAIERHESVMVYARDEFGNEFTKTLTGLESVAFQHEYDHLEGVLFVDRVSRLKKRFMLKKLQKIKKRHGLVL